MAKKQLKAHRNNGKICFLKFDVWFDGSLAFGTTCILWFIMNASEKVFVDADADNLQKRIVLSRGKTNAQKKNTKNSLTLFFAKYKSQQKIRIGAFKM